jgi:hypothetical protein
VEKEELSVQEMREVSKYGLRPVAYSINVVERRN